MPSLIKKL